VPHSKSEIQSAFPKLRPDSFEIIGNEDPDYNCIAWAAGNSSRNWWPPPPGAPVFSDLPHWPDDVPAEETLAAFMSAYHALGYEACDSPALEVGFEKIAIYLKDGVPKHASRQLSNGRWSSKLGRAELIAHDFDALEGEI
jgi:hypothetical protein